MSKDDNLKNRVIKAGYVAIDELIKVLNEPIITENEDEQDLSADRLKNAAATKKLALFDAFEMHTRLMEEELSMQEEDTSVVNWKAKRK